MDDSVCSLNAAASRKIDEQLSSLPFSAQEIRFRQKVTRLLLLGEPTCPGEGITCEDRFFILFLQSEQMGTSIRPFYVIANVRLDSHQFPDI